MTPLLRAVTLVLAVLAVLVAGAGSATAAADGGATAGRGVGAARRRIGRQPQPSLLSSAPGAAFTHRRHLTPFPDLSRRSTP